MRRLAVLIALAGLLALALPALAKGPQTATLTIPGQDEPVLFLDQNMDGQTWSDRIRITGLWFGEQTPVEEPPENLGDPYTVRWYQVSGAAPIIEHIYPDAEGGPLVHTPEQPGLWTDDMDGWFQASDDAIAQIEQFVASVGIDADGTRPPWILPALGMIVVGALILAGTRFPPTVRRPSPAHPGTQPSATQGLP